MDTDPAIRSGATLASARMLLRTIWGYPDFRYHQRKAVLAALRGRDCLAVLPTGGGKSLCFQVPALVLPGISLVVSPLISLMQDQVNAIRARGVPAAFLSSTQSPAERRAVDIAAQSGRLKLLYVAPERLRRLLARVPRIEVALLAVDEAHCISEWGHDFRRHYRALGGYRRLMRRPPTMALTATATPETCRDIIRVLGLTRPVRVAQSFDRPNLFFAARRFPNEASRLAAAAPLTRLGSGSVIVYAQTRNRTDGVAALLSRWGISAAPYHAGLPGAARRDLLQRFLDGQVRVMVATSAFGMGIDKPDVRLVLHLGVPTRPESYFQEAGRAGRDGQPARCLMFWTSRDLTLAARMARRTGQGTASPALARARDHALAVMRRYVRSRRCRRQVLLAYLGERIRQCTGCDRCGPDRGNHA